MKKEAKCPLCDSTDFRLFHAMYDYKLAECNCCGMVWDPNPKIKEIYGKDYYTNNNPKGGYANYFEGMKVNSKTFGERLRKIKKEFGTGRLLDVGCALGDCLEEAKKLGWKYAEGIEISVYASRYARKKGLKVKTGELGKCYSKPRFDIILYQDVIEHVKDPLKELSEAFHALKSGGIIYITTPNIKGIMRKILGSWWYHFKPGEHLLYFSPKTLQIALEKAGFKEIRIKPAYHIMSLGYIANRLVYYSPWFFGRLRKLLNKTRMSRIPFRIYIGNMEATARKPV